jgi:hypothetical protein
MKRFIGITLVFSCFSFNNIYTQESSSLEVKPDVTEKKDIDINLNYPQNQKVTIFKHNGLRLQSGDSYNYSHGSNQLLFSYYKTRFFTHAIKTRHQKENNTGNAIDFYVWDNGIDDSSTVGSKLVMSLNAGNVGIGTANPKTKLHVCSDTSYVGFKLQNRQHEFDIELFDLGGGSRSRFYLEDKLKMEFCPGCKGPRVTSLIICEDLEIPYNYSTLDLSYTKGINYVKNGSYRFSIRETGDATFDGKITAKEIEVKAKVWADHVFSDEFELPDLSVVEDFISENNHLPGIPAESEIIENGLNIGEMNAILIQKIEELTLYIIEQEKRITDLENKLYLK